MLLQGERERGSYKGEKNLSCGRLIISIHLTKLIVERIRPLLENVISPLQTTFVPSRKGINNAIIVQELVHTLSKKKRQNQVYGN